MQVNTTNRPKAPPRPGELAAAKNNTADSDAGSTGAGGKSLRGNAKHAGLPAHLRKAAVFRRLAERVSVTVHGDSEKEKGSPEMDGWTDQPVLNAAKADADKAIALLTGAAESLEALGPEFSPTEKRTRSSRAKKLEAGTPVRLRDKARESNRGLMTEEEMNSLKVLQHAGAKVLVQTSDGAKLLVARGHLELVDGSDAGDAEDGDDSDASDDDATDGDEE